MFVITPHLVKPLPPDYALPTDHFNEPTRGEFFLGGTLEGSPGYGVAAAAEAGSAGVRCGRRRAGEVRDR